MAVNPAAWVVIAVGAAVAEIYAFVEAIKKTIEVGEDLGEVIMLSIVHPFYAYMVASVKAEEKQRQWQQSLKDTKTIVDDLAASFNTLRDAMKLSGASDSELYHAEYNSLRERFSELKMAYQSNSLGKDEKAELFKQMQEISSAISELNKKRLAYLKQVQALKNGTFALDTEQQVNSAISIVRKERSQSKTGSETWNYWNTLEQSLKNRLPQTSTFTPRTAANTNNGKVKVPVEPEFITGPSGFNEQTIAAWTSMIKDQLSKADIGTELYNNLTDNLSDMSRLTTTVQDAIKLGLDIPQDQVQRMYEEVFDQNNLPEGMYDDMIEKFIEDFKIKTGKDLKIGSDGKLTEGKGGSNRKGIMVRKEKNNSPTKLAN
jgi:hypothetical protein